MSTYIYMYHINKRLWVNIFCNRNVDDSDITNAERRLSQTLEMIIAKKKKYKNNYKYNNICIHDTE